MVKVWALFVLFVLSCIASFFLLINAIFSEKKRGAIISAVLAVFSAVIQWINMDIPSPQIYPLNNEIPLSRYEYINIKSYDGLKIYFTLDGSDPKYGELYTDEIKIESSTTIAARTKFIFWWSDIQKSNYMVEESSLSNEEAGVHNNPDETISNSLESCSEANTSNSQEENAETKSNQITPIETHTPNDVVWSVDLLNWDVNCDYGINGNRYSGGIKVVISNMFTSMGSGTENQITSRIMLPLNDSNDKRFSGIIILDQSMYGSASSATIRILANNEELYSTGEIDGNTTSAFPFDVNAEDADSYIIETTATLRGTSFVFGLVDPEDD